MPALHESREILLKGKMKTSTFLQYKRESVLFISIIPCFKWYLFFGYVLGWQDSSSQAVPLICAHACIHIVYLAWPALPWSALIAFALGPMLQSSSSPFLSLQTQPVSRTQ